MGSLPIRGTRSGPAGEAPGTPLSRGAKLLLLLPFPGLAGLVLMIEPCLGFLASQGRIGAWSTGDLVSLFDLCLLLPLAVSAAMLMFGLLAAFGDDSPRRDLLVQALAWLDILILSAIGLWLVYENL